MQARGPLMIEHRLIERMIAVVREAIGDIEKSSRVDPVFIDMVVDFIRTYADRTHHGKEEDIMFKTLENKEMSETDRRVMNELIEEHLLGRKLTGQLVEANGRYRKGDSAALSEIADKLKRLVDFYPKHIEKEDKNFFPASKAYLTDAEDRDMLAEFYEFDRKMIHEKYQRVVIRAKGMGHGA